MKCIFDQNEEDEMVTQNHHLRLLRRKTRAIESNAKCRYLKKLTCKGTLRQVFYLAEAPSPPMNPYTPPPYTLSPYSHREGGGGELTREKVERQ
jgi:hypothetical protein